MIKSMTGYGRGKHQIEGVEVLVEIKTINHRFCDVSIKLPRNISLMEDKVRELVGGKIARGKVEVYISYHERLSQSTDLYLDTGLVASYISTLEKLKEDFNLIDDISVSLVSRFPDIIKMQTNQIDEKELWETLKLPVKEALTSLVSMREFEGEKLCNNLVERLNLIKEYVLKISKRAPEIPKEYGTKLSNRIEELLNQKIVDEQRLSMEIALIADKCNIDEEIERLNSHTDQFLSLLLADEAVGRKLDFLLQEMNREINTVGSKANDINIVKDVVEIKSEIEKIREQIQNIE